MNKIFLTRYGKNLEFSDILAELEYLIVLEPTGVMRLPRDSLPIEIMNATHGEGNFEFRDSLFSDSPLSGECPNHMLDDFGNNYKIYYNDANIFVALV